MDSDKRDPEYGYPAQEMGVQFAKTTNVLSLEILSYEAVNRAGKAVMKGTKNVKSLTDGDVADWISENPERETIVKDLENDVILTAKFSGALRVMFGSCSHNKDSYHRVLPFRQDDFKLIEERMKIPEQFVPGLLLKTAFAASFSCSGLNVCHNDTNTRFVPFLPASCHLMKFSIYRPSAYQIAVSHSRETSITYVLVLSKTPDHRFSEIMDALTFESKSYDALNPLHCPLVIAGLCYESSASRVQTSDTRLNDLEEALGQHEWINRPLGDPLSIDFVQTGRRLNFIARVLGVETTRVLGLLQTLEEIQKIDSELRSEKRDLRVLEMVKYWENLSRMLALRVQYEEKRVQSQLAVVYQFMTQKDAKVNIELAATSATIASETRKDGSAMKTIAILTMCFLPGTFLAALFAMPLFNWDEEKGPFFKAQFKYYWAIAIPLTFIVLAIWAFAIFAPWRKWLTLCKSRLKRRDLETAGKKE